MSVVINGAANGGSPVTTAPTTYTATYSSLTNATAVTKWRRDGKYLKLYGQVKWTGAGPSANFTVDLPGAEAGTPLIDTDALPGGTGAANGTTSDLGYGFWFDNGAGWAAIYPVFVDTNTVGFVMNTQVFNSDQAANGDSMNYFIEVPIVGWN